jgi:hypothetical protein
VPKILQDVPFSNVCPTCGRVFVLSVYQRCEFRKGKSKRLFCGKKCYLDSVKGEGNPKWRGGKIIERDGYIYIWKPNHPYANHAGYVFEHRLVMENVLGRYLEPQESVHHIDGTHNNNAPNNLMLMKTEGEHRKLHAKYRTYKNGRYYGHKEGVMQYV